MSAGVIRPVELGYGITRHRPGLVTLCLPVPPGSNNRLRPGLTAGGRPRLYLVKKIRDYNAAIASILLFLPKPVPTRDVGVACAWFRASPQDGDVDNRLKVILDQLKGRAYVDDRQIRQLSIERFDHDPDRPRFTVTIEVLA